MSKNVKEVQAKKLTTDCIDCVFAKFENETQTKCEIGRVETYKERGFVVDKVTDESTKLEYYKIEGALCSLNRGKEWIEHVVKDGDASEIVYEESRIPVGYFLEAVGLQSYEEILEAVQLTANTMPSMKDKRSFITVFTDTNLTINQIIQLSASIESITNINTKVLIDNQSNLEPIDEASRTFKNGYLVCVKAGEKITIDPEEKINNAIIKDLKSVSYLDSDEEFSGYAFSTFVFKNLRGNRGIPIKQKLQEMEKYYNQKGIYSWSEV